MKVISAEFRTGAVSVDRLPSISVPEIMMCGSSNAGKSSLINRLTNKRDLARVSKEPGKTREMNYFHCMVEDGARKQRHLGLVDMPGFGFAKVSKQEREQMARMTVEYITGRGEQLKCVLLLVDPKRGAGEDETALLPVAARALKPLFVVATKCDRFNQKERAQYLKALAEACRCTVPDLIVTGDGLPLDPLWKRIESLMFS